MTLQEALNPDARPRIERFGYVYAPGDKVMQLENDYDRNIYNGDLGFVTKVDQEEGALTATFDDRAVEYELSELDALTLAYGVPMRPAMAGLMGRPLRRYDP